MVLINFLILYEKDNNGNSDLYSLENKPATIIDYESTLPLTNELKYFIDVIQGKSINKATLNEGIDVVKILEMATESLKQQNKTFINLPLQGEI